MYRQLSLPPPPPLLAGSIPSSWANDLPGSAQVTVLPNGNLCGSVPNQPDLHMVSGGEQYPVVNSLGSCFRSECNPTNTGEAGVLCSATTGSRAADAGLVQGWF